MHAIFGTLFFAHAILWHIKFCTCTPLLFNYLHMYLNVGFQSANKGVSDGHSLLTKAGKH